MREIQEVKFDPGDPLDGQHDPVHDLTLAIRGLRLGGRVRMPDNTLVVSQVVQIGPHKERRFTVIPPQEGSSAAERHQAYNLGHGAYKTARTAALKALGKEGKGGS